MSRTSPQTPGRPSWPGTAFVRHIGAGGNAQVYLYEQDLPHRKVAVKVLNESALSAAARRRFTAEANVTAGLAHRHIVQVFDAKVTSDGRPYIVMPYYPQPNLFVRARRAHFSVAEVLRIGIQIGSAVETSHRRGVLHRDIKPQNILTDSYGEPALTDFGIATTKGGDGAEGLSVPWSPPEILYGTGPGDQRSDVYSLGATLWHLLVGRSPFEQPGGDNTTVALMGRIKSDPPPRTQRADVPDSLERLLRQAMAKDPAARPQSAMELIRGLQSIEQELRLPLTHPILPADEPAWGNTRGDTVARPAANAGEFTVSREHATAVTDSPPVDRGQAVSRSQVQQVQQVQQIQQVQQVQQIQQVQQVQQVQQIQQVQQVQQVLPAPEAPAEPLRDESAWSGETQDATMVRAGRSADPGQPAVAPGQPAVAPGQRAAALGTATARPRIPVLLDPSGGVAPAMQGTQEVEGSREIQGTRELRGTRERSRRGRILMFAGGGALLAIVAAVAVLALPRGSGGQPGAGQATQSAGQSEYGSAPVPGQPTVTSSRANAEQVEFRWTYANSASHDTFRVQVSGGAGQPVSMVTQPDLLLTVAKGHRACITVTVRSADGEASQPSNQLCWTN